MANEIGIIRSFRINITIALLLFLIGIIVILIFIFVPQWNKELIFGGSVIVAFCALYSAYYIAYGLKENIRLDSINRALEFAKRFDDARSLRLRNLMLKERQNLAPDELVKKIEDDEELHISLRQILALFEDSSIAIQMGIVDERTLYLSIVTLVTNFFECFEEFIKKSREQFNDKTIYREFEVLYRNWKINKSILTGKNIE